MLDNFWISLAAVMAVLLIAWGTPWSKAKLARALPDTLATVADTFVALARVLVALVTLARVLARGLAARAVRRRP